MGRDFFRAQKGIHIVGENLDTGVHYLFGAGVPGSNTQENDAEVGSIYSDTNAPGYQYHKKSAGSGTDKWVRIANYDDILNNRYRNEHVVAITTMAAPIEGGTIDLATPLTGDETPFLVGTDFTVGDCLLFGHGGTEVIGQVSDVTGDVLTITYIGLDPLAAKDVFIVDNNLLDSPGDQEGQSIFLFNGTDYIKLGDVNWDFADGIHLAVSYTPGSGDISSADTVNSAIQKLDGNVDALNTLTGMPQGATHLGTFTGTVLATINQTIKQALQNLATAIDSLNTLSGVALNALHLGTFTGETIADNRKIKEALQDLETQVELAYLQRTSLNVTGTTVVDSVLVDNFVAVEWLVTCELVSDPSRRVTEKIIAVHNGTNAADATTSDDDSFSILRVGAQFTRTLNVDLNGTGAAQVMRLTAAAPVGINVRVERSVIRMI